MSGSGKEIHILCTLRNEIWSVKYTRPDVVLTMRSTLFALFIAFWTLSTQAQDCSSALTNVLCVDEDPVAGGLEANPVAFDCFNSVMTYYATFHTGSVAGGSAIISVTPGDCDDFDGPNDLYIVGAELPAGADPCNPISFGDVLDCATSSVAFDYTMNNLAADTDYLIVLGSDHDPIYGPCEFDLTISGSAVDVTVTLEPFIVYLGGSTQLTAFNGTSYTWTPGDYLSDTTIPNPVSTPEQTIDYTVSSTVGTCDVSTTVTVTVGPPLVIYDGITPNGDLINDTWTIVGIERFESAMVTVYDRWGQLIFKSTGYAKPWDGTNKGKELPMGPYYYVIELNSFDVSIPPITGVISIIK